MGRSLKKVTSVFLAVLMTAQVCAAGASEVRGAKTDIKLPKGRSDIERSLINYSNLAATDTGYVRVTSLEDYICVEEYNKDFEITAKRQIANELSYYGGFYSGSDAYYLVFGQNNPDEIDETEVVRVVKYSKDWQRLGDAKMHGSASYYADEIRYPFNHGTVEMLELNGKLYLVTGHQSYVDPQYNMGHQGYLMFEIDEATMDWTICDSDNWHSFSQHIAAKDADNIYTLEESEGSRCSKLTKRTTQNLNGTAISVLDYGGSRTSAWAIATYATADTIAVSDSYVLAAGSSIDQTRYDDSEYKRTYNLYLTATPMDDFSADATRFQWVTTCNSNQVFRFVYLTKINDNRFLLSWECFDPTGQNVPSDINDPLSTHEMHCVFVDGKGKVVSDEYKFKAALSQCRPIYDNGKVVFSASDGSNVDFYTIDTEGNFSKKVYRLAGEGASWELKDGVLTITGSGKINDGFGSPLAPISDKITKVVIGEGITEIGETAFYNFNTMTEVELPSTLRKLGNGCFKYCTALDNVRIPKGVTEIPSMAFYGIRNLKHLYVPMTVTSIAEDAFQTGYYWIGSGNPVLANVAFGCEPDSYAVTYATEHSLRTEFPTLELAEMITPYTGEAVAIGEATPNITTGEITYVYFTDEACTVKTNAANSGAASEGGAPVLAGTYYAMAYVNDDLVFGQVNSAPAKLTISDDSSIGDIAAFVNRIYTYVLDRAPEKDGAKYWADELYNFRRSGAEIATEFVFSKEFIDRKTSNEDFVTILYKTFFNRDPEEDGFKFWVDNLKNGMSREDVAYGFINSPEWADTCASYGIRSGGESKAKVKIEPTDLTYGFVERLYTTAMKREYDADGREYWAGRLSNFEITGEFAGASFFLSEEMQSFGLSDTEYLERLYATFMNRESDEEGMAFWLKALSEGFTRQDVVMGFTRSPEFVGKCVEARILPY